MVSCERPGPIQHTAQKKEKCICTCIDEYVNKSPLAYPGILPFVGHGDNIFVMEMNPFPCIAAQLARLRWFGLVRIPLKPLLHYVVVELL